MPMLGHNIIFFDKAHHSKHCIVHLSLFSRLHQRVIATIQHILMSQLCSSPPRQRQESLCQGRLFCLQSASPHKKCTWGSPLPRGFA